MVAIADVAAYVTPASPLTRARAIAAFRSICPTGWCRCCPNACPNDLCSLREGEERPCLAVRMVFDRNGNQIGHRFIRGWMRSAAKLAYEEAQAAIDGQGSGKAEMLLEDVLKPLWGAYDALRSRPQAS